MSALLVALWLAGLARAADLECGAELYANDLLPFAQQGITISKELAVKNIPEFCRATTRNQAQKDISPSGVSSDKEFKDSEIEDAWLRSFHPEPLIRQDAFFKSRFLKPLGLNSFEAARAYLQNPDPSKAVTGDRELSTEQDARQLNKLSGFGVKEVAMAAACNELVFGFECPGALDKVVKMSMPSADALSITQPQLYKEFLSDSSYDEGLKRAALKILDRVEKRDTAGADLFTDVKTSFLESGVPAAKADEMTWKTMGLMATGGPNTAIRMQMLKSDASAFPRKVSISVISELAATLDSLSIASGHPYSYPPGIHSTCDSGKPYHFWLTAYLGWELSRTGTSSKAAAAAAFLGDKGYQMMSDTTTRDPTLPLREDFLSTYSNSIRMDLAVASAGAIYGANAGKGAAATKLDIDEGVRQVVLGSQPVDRLSEEEAKTLFASPLKYGLQWSKLMAPNAAFSLYRPAIQ